LLTYHINKKKNQILIMLA